MNTDRLTLYVKSYILDKKQYRRYIMFDNFNNISYLYDTKDGYPFKMYITTDTNISDKDAVIGYANKNNYELAYENNNDIKCKVDINSIHTDMKHIVFENAIVYDDYTINTLKRMVNDYIDV